MFWVTGGTGGEQQNVTQAGARDIQENEEGILEGDAGSWAEGARGPSWTPGGGLGMWWQLEEAVWGAEAGRVEARRGVKVRITLTCTMGRWSCNSLTWRTDLLGCRWTEREFLI